MNGLEVTDLHKRFGSQAVLRGIELAVEEGSFTSILGPSGSGKTTLLRIVAGFERADRGTVRLGGEVVEDGDTFLTPDRRRIGYVPQDGSLFPHLSVEQNVGFGLPPRDRRGRAVAGLLEMVGLAGLERRYPHQLSGGQQQRVALARALAIGPKLVLLDEPFSSLDATLRASVRQDVRRVLREAGTTALLVTHDQDEALSLADHIAIIADGRIGQVGTPREVYSIPVSPDLARGLGETNFLSGVVRRSSVATALGLLPLENGPLGDGSEVVVLVRPEQIDVVDHHANAVALPAEVLASEFYGHNAIVRVRTLGERATIITVRSTDVDNLPKVGAHVEIAVRGGVIAWLSPMEATLGPEAAQPS